MIGTTRSRVSFFMNRFRKLGLIEYNGRIRIHKSLINVILHDQFTEHASERAEDSAAPSIRGSIQSIETGRARVKRFHNWCKPESMLQGGVFPKETPPCAM